MAANEGTEIITAGSNNNLLQKIREPKTLIFILFLLVLIAILAASAFYYTNKKNQQSIKESEVAATVNGEKILKADYERNLKAQEYFYTQFYQKKSKETVSNEFIKGLRESTINRLVQEKLLTQYLSDKGIEVTNEEIRNIIQKDIVNKAWKGDWQAYEKDLKETYNTNLEYIMGNFRRDLLIQKVIAEEKINPADFDKWYGDFKAKEEVEIYVDLEGSN